jgi:hypothetical protein
MADCTELRLSQALPCRFPEPQLRSPNRWEEHMGLEAQETKLSIFSESALSRDSVGRAEEVFTDILTMDLAHSSPEFLSYIGSVAGETGPLHLVSLKHTVADSSLGETDIEIVVRTETGLCALLIENKVRAPIMPRQFERYRLRGEAGVAAGRWTRFRVLLLCPEGYFIGLAADHKQYVDGNVSYEDVVVFLGEKPEFAFKRHVFENALVDYRKGYAKVADAPMMVFYRHYWQIATAEYPQLRMSLPDVVGKDGSWIYFPSLYAGTKVRLLHKFKGIGCELAVVTCNGEALANALSPLLDPDVVARVTKSMLFLNLKTPAIDHLLDFPLLAPVVRDSLAALERLRNFAIRPDVATAIKEHL